MTGLTEKEVLISREKHGSNCLPKKEKKGFFKMVLENLSDPIIRILIGALIANIIFTFRNINWAESLGILIAVIIATVVSVISERSGEKAFEKMNEVAGMQEVRVLREGQYRQIPATDLVVGDLIMIGSGERVPADGRILTGELDVDQSALNGESKNAKKIPGETEDKSLNDTTILFCGSMVLRGSGIVMITGVGENTVYGAIASELQSEVRESPMKHRLSQLAKVISNIGYVAAGVVALAYLFNAFVLNSSGSEEMLSKCRDLHFVLSSTIRAVTIGITVIVVAVPEGLPMMLTVVLAANMKRMYQGKVLVRKPIGIETAGNMNILFCDKTGTITTGNLTLESLYLGNLKKIGSPGELRRCINYLPHFMLQAHYNSEAIYERGKAVGGNATERAILNFAGKGKPGGVWVAHRIPFDSRNKYSAVTLGGLYTAITCYKGAPEILLARCTTYLDENGNVQTLKDKKALLRKIHEISSNMGRVVLLCESESECADCNIPAGLTMVAMVAMRDEIRPKVPNAIKRMTSAGVQTVMVTGDSRETAQAIARRCGIMSDTAQGIILTSEEMAGYSDAELRNVLPRLCVVARALPQDKSRLVRVAQDAGLIVGMTGDGVNDAPALKMADVGFAMGSGTDVAREAGDIVILDCDFSSIVRAVLYGRTIFRSVRKFIVFQLTMNLCAVGISLFGQIVGIETPITVIQMLWVNIIMDTLGALAFAGEAPLEIYMHEKPKRRNDPILSKNMIQKILIMGAYTVLISTLFLYSPRIRNIFDYKNDPTRLLTAFFALFIFCGILICFTARSDGRRLLSGIGKNKPFIWIMTAIFAVQILMLYFGGSTFRCVPLTLKELLIVLAFSLTVLPVDGMRRLFALLQRK